MIDNSPFHTWIMRNNSPNGLIWINLRGNERGIDDGIWVHEAAPEPLGPPRIDMSYKFQDAAPAQAFFLK